MRNDERPGAAKIDGWKQIRVSQICRRKLGRYIADDVVLPLAQCVAARLGDLGRSPFEYPVGPIAPLREFAAKGPIELGYGRFTVVDPAALDHFAGLALPDD